MPDDLLDRLPDLAPGIDEPGARRALDDLRATVRQRHRHRRRTRRLAGAGLAVAAVVAAVLVIRIDRGDRGDGHLVTAGPSQPEAAPFTTTVRVGDFEATVILPTGRVVLGRDAPVEVRVRNLSSAPQTLYELGHCAGPLIADPVLPPSYPTWDGSSPLVELLHDPAVAATPAAVNEGGLGLGTPGCDYSLKTDPVPPGDTRSWVGVLDGRVGPGTTGDVVLRVSLGVGVDARLAGRGEPLTVRSDPIRLPTTDDPDRTTSTDEALEALATSPYVRQFVDDTRQAATLPQGMARQWHPTIGWWEGAWELRLNTAFSAEVLRIRYDPKAGRVVDARVVKGCPDDAPTCDGNPSDVPDDLLSRPGG